MPSGFEVAHRDRLQGALICVERLIVHGHLSRLWFPNHMAYFLNRLGVHIAQDFGRFVKHGVRDRDQQPGRLQGAVFRARSPWASSWQLEAHAQGHTHNLWRYVQIGEATNRRYLDGLAEVKPTAEAVAQLDSLCHPRLQDGRQFSRFNTVARADTDAFQAVLSAAHLINGPGRVNLRETAEFCI